MRAGDRVDVVLDCVTEVEDGRMIARVYVRLVDAPASEGGKPPPASPPGAYRNVVQRWLGVEFEANGAAAFGIDIGPVEEVASRG